MTLFQNCILLETEGVVYMFMRVWYYDTIYDHQTSVQHHIYAINHIKPRICH